MFILLALLDTIATAGTAAKAAAPTKKEKMSVIEHVAAVTFVIGLLVLYVVASASTSQQ